MNIDVFASPYADKMTGVVGPEVNAFIREYGVEVPSE